MKSKLLYALLMGMLPIAAAVTAQNAAEVDQDVDPASKASPASSQVTPADVQTLHTNQSGVVTRIAVENPADIDLFSGTKKLSEWFDQFCTGTSARGREAMIRANALTTQAREAILDLGAEAVPYLLGQLSLDPTGEVEQQLRQMRNSAWSNTVTLDYLDSIMLPSTRRSGAAQLLGNIGAPAQEALPVLIELWTRHSELNRTPYYLGIRNILHELNPKPELVPKEFQHQTEYFAFQTNVVAAAIEYCPQLPDDVRSQFAPLLEAAEEE